MGFRGALACLVACALLAVGVAAAPPAPAVATHPEDPQVPPAKASITFDADTGRVVAADNARTPVAVASTIKLFTALIAKDHIAMDEPVPITHRAAEVQPLKLTMEPGSRWMAGDLMKSMLIASLNDTAMALAIHAGDGSLEGYAELVEAEAERLGLADDPVVRDPSGLDGPDGVGGGNLISARDLAIVTRAFLADDELTAIAGMREYHFDGGDGLPHVVYNHNAFLTMYPGALGLKTGYTERSGHSLVAAARRDGRTLATVVIDSPDPVGHATAQLDAAFAAGPDAAGTGDVLPEPAPEPTTTLAAPAETGRGGGDPPVQEVQTSGVGTWVLGGAMLMGIAVLTTLTVGVRRRVRADAARSGPDRS